VSDVHCPATVLLVRHDDAGDDAAVLAEPRGDLTARGRDRARTLGASLDGARVSLIYTSPIPRAVQTAGILATSTGAAIVVRDDLDAPPAGADTGSRMRAVLDAVADEHRGETVLVLASASAVRAALAGLVGGPDDVMDPESNEPVVLTSDADGWVRHGRRDEMRDSGGVCGDTGPWGESGSGQLTDERSWGARAG
jgi:2,3-bisphosphoglycerate-dependent phosphoglycerate mutase